MALGVPSRLRPWIISTFSTTMVVGHQPDAPAAFTPGEIPVTHFQRLSRPQGTWFCQKEPRKKSSVTPPGVQPRTVRLVAQRLNHYATPGPRSIYIYIYIQYDIIHNTLKTSKVNSFGLFTGHQQRSLSQTLQGQRKVWSSGGSTHCTCQLTALSMLCRVWCHMTAIQLTPALNCVCTSFRVMT